MKYYFVIKFILKHSLVWTLNVSRGVGADLETSLIKA